MFNYTNNPTLSSLTISREVIRLNGKLQKHFVCGIKADYNRKERIKEWCKKHDGGWDIINKWWYIPFCNLDDLDKILNEAKEYKDSFNYGTTISWVGSECQIEKLKQLLIKHQEDFETITETSPLYNEHPDFTIQIDDDEVCLLPQKQLIVGGQRCIFFESQPSDYQSVMGQDISAQYRSYKGGWIYPWTNPQNRYDCPFWNDELQDQFNNKKPQNVEEELTNGIKIRVQGSKNKPEHLRIKILSKENYLFDRWKNYCRSNPGTKFDWDTKEWIIPVTSKTLTDLLFTARVLKSGILTSEGVKKYFPEFCIEYQKMVKSIQEDLS